MALLVIWLVGTSAASGVILNWDTLTWTPGALSQSYDIDASNPGNDVTITISGTTSAFFNGNPALVSGKGGIAEKALQFKADFVSNNDSLTVTVQFNYANGVTGTVFKLLDVDFHNAVDKVSAIKGSYGSGLAFGANITAEAGAVVANNNTTNATITGVSDITDTLSGANATLNYGTNRMDKTVFTFGTSTANPAAQAFYLHDISFTPVVPEVNQGIAALALCILLISSKALGASGGFRTMRGKRSRSPAPRG